MVRSGILLPAESHALLRSAHDSDQDSDGDRRSAATSASALSLLDPSVLPSTIDPVSAPFARMINLYLCTGALLAYRSERAHVYAPEAGVDLLSFIDDSFRHIFASKRLREADEEFVGCWLETKRQLERARSDVRAALDTQQQQQEEQEEEGREAFKIPERAARRLEKAGREDLVQYWRAVQLDIEQDVSLRDLCRALLFYEHRPKQAMLTRISLERLCLTQPDRLDPSLHPFDTFLGLVLQQAGRHFQRLQADVEAGAAAGPGSPSSSSPLKKTTSAAAESKRSPMRLANGYGRDDDHEEADAHSQSTVAALAAEARSLLQPSSTHRQNGRADGSASISDSPLLQQPTSAVKVDKAKSRAYSRASLPASALRSKNDLLLADLEATNSQRRKKRASTGGAVAVGGAGSSVQSLRQRLVRLDQLERSSPAPPTAKGDANRHSVYQRQQHGGDEEAEDQTGEADDSIQAVSKMLLFKPAQALAAQIQPQQPAAAPMNGGLANEDREDEEAETQVAHGRASEPELEMQTQGSTQEDYDAEMQELIDAEIGEIQRAEEEEEEEEELLLDRVAMRDHSRAEDVFASNLKGLSAVKLSARTKREHGETHSQPIDAETEDLVMAEVLDTVDRSAELGQRFIPSSMYRAREKEVEAGRHASINPQYRAHLSPSASKTTSTARAFGAEARRVQFDSQGGLRRIAAPATALTRAEVLESAGAKANHRATGVQRGLIASMLERQPDAERIEMDTPPLSASSRRKQRRASSPVRASSGRGTNSEVSVTKRSKPAPASEQVADDFYAPDDDAVDRFLQPEPDIPLVKFDDGQEQDDDDEELPPPLGRGPPGPTLEGDDDDDDDDDDLPDPPAPATSAGQPEPAASAAPAPASALRSIIKPASARRAFMPVETSSSGSEEDDDDVVIERLLTAQAPPSSNATPAAATSRKYAKGVRPASSQNEASKDPERSSKRAPPPEWKKTIIRPVVIESNTSAGEKRKRGTVVQSSEVEEEEEEFAEEEEDENELPLPIASVSAKKASKRVPRMSTGPSRPKPSLGSRMGADARSGRKAPRLDQELSDTDYDEPPFPVRAGPKPRRAAPQPTATAAAAGQPPKRKRGRPRKVPAPVEHAQQQDEEVEMQASEAAAAALEEKDDFIDQEDAEEQVFSDGDAQAEAGPSRSPAAAGRKAQKAAPVGSQEDELQSSSSSEYDPAEDLRTPTQTKASAAAVKDKGKGKARAAGASSSAAKSTTGAASGRRKPGRPHKVVPAQNADGDDDGAYENAAAAAASKWKKGDPSRYKTGQYRHWSKAETDCILQCLAEDRDATVKQILRMHGKDGQESSVLEGRKNDGVKDKIHE